MCNRTITTLASTGTTTTSTATSMPTAVSAASLASVVGHSHDHADSVDDALTSSARGIRAVKISLVGLGLTAVAQLAVVMISGSVALLADTIHNFSDALTAIPLWIAFALGTRAATRRYTFGYRRAEDLAGPVRAGDDPGLGDPRRATSRSTG